MKKAEKDFKTLGIVGAINFPVVLKTISGNGDPEIAVIYQNRVEYYQLYHRVNNTVLKKQDDTYNPYTELQMILGNGGRIIRGGDY